MCRPSWVFRFSSSRPHRSRSGLQSAVPTGLAPPEKLNQFLGIDVLEWYHPSVSMRQQENTRKGVPPAKNTPTYFIGIRR